MRALRCAFVASLAIAVACGGATTTTLQRHATAAQLSADLISDAGDRIQKTLRAREDTALASATDQDDARAKVNRVRANLQPLELSYEAVRRAHAAYVDAVRDANQTGGTVSSQLIEQLKGAWLTLSEQGLRAQVPLPKPPTDALADAQQGQPP